ncbi:MAG: mannose-6-phosphate isomerase [Actinomycetota bacterium]|nr:mannose-6-phosphate isomerase [Actinomycetota bacterium]
MNALADEAILDDTQALAAADPGGLLRTLAGAGAQVRAAQTFAEEAGVHRLADDGRPRAILLAGVGGSGSAGDLLQAVLGVAAPVPIVLARGSILPGWVGPTDLVLAVSCSGTTEETLAVVDEAGRRGARLLTVGAPRSPLAARADWTRAVHVPVNAGAAPPRTQLWALAVPLVLATEALGLLNSPPGALAATADRLDRLAERCAPGRERFENPAKILATELLDTLPLVWGSGDAGAAAAARLATQLQENAKLPALAGVLPEAGHNQVVAFDGPFAGAGSGSSGSSGSGSLDDFFRDRVDEPIGPRLRLVLLRDEVEHPLVRARAAVVPAVAGARDVPVSLLRAEGASTLERAASLIGIGDFASVYVALASGIDPLPIAPIAELKERSAG